MVTIHLSVKEKLESFHSTGLYCWPLEPSTIHLIACPYWVPRDVCGTDFKDWRGGGLRSLQSGLTDKPFTQRQLRNKIVHAWFNSFQNVLFVHLLCIYSNLTCINCVNICYCHLCVNSWGERTITYVMSLSIKILQWDFFLRSWQSLGTKLTVLWQTIRAVENGSKNCLQALVNSVRLWLEIEKRKMRWDLYSFLPGVIF